VNDCRRHHTRPRVRALFVAERQPQKTCGQLRSRGQEGRSSRGSKRIGVITMSPVQYTPGGGGTRKGIVRGPIDARLWVRGEVPAVARGRVPFGAVAAAPPWSIVLWHVVALSRSSSVLRVGSGRSWPLRVCHLAAPNPAEGCDGGDGGWACLDRPAHRRPGDAPAVGRRAGARSSCAVVASRLGGGSCC
jgi:hypothetical protein